MKVRGRSKEGQNQCWMVKASVIERRSVCLKSNWWHCQSLWCSCWVWRSLLHCWWLCLGPRLLESHCLWNFEKVSMKLMLSARKWWKAISSLSRMKSESQMR